jgi:hypothetical protein
LTQTPSYDLEICTAWAFDTAHFCSRLVVFWLARLAKKNSQRVAALPLYQLKADSGTFRLPVGSYEYLVRVAGMQHQNAPNLILLGNHCGAKSFSKSLSHPAVATRDDGYLALQFA